MGADGKRGMEEAELCCPTRLQRPLDRDQDSETVADRRQGLVGTEQISDRKKKEGAFCKACKSKESEEATKILQTRNAHHSK